MNANSIQLMARTTPFGVADLRTQAGLVSLWLGTDTGRMGFGMEITPACARELAAALLAHADAADQEGGAE